MEKYTTKELKEAISLSKEISQEDKDAELKKVEISNDAFAVIDYIEKLNKNLERLRVGVLMR